MGGRPNQPRTDDKTLLRPKAAKMPKIATITGKINGAPNTVTSAPRPKNRRRARARAAGIAKPTETTAEQVACKTVNRTAAQSAADKDALWARFATTTKVPSVNASTSAAAATPGQRA